MSEAEARRVLAADVALFAKDVRASLTREVSRGQFSALVSFAFNVGVPAFRGSSVLRAVNEGRLTDVPGRLKLWVKADGRVLPGLEKRRAAEAAMFMSTPQPRALAPVVAGGAAAAAATASSLAGAGAWAMVFALAALAGLVIWWRLRLKKEVW